MFRGATAAFALIFLVLSPAMAENLASCECPKLSCNDNCEIEEAVTFYSEKCPDGVRVRSCARPTCVKKDPYPKVCEAQALSTSKPEEKPLREVASQDSVTEKQRVGVIQSLLGVAWSYQKGLAPKALSVGDQVTENDTLKTGDASKLEVQFEDGNRVALAENSEVFLKNITFSDDDKKRDVLLQLLKGKVRSDVKQKYKGANNQFRVQTKGAVAGVRGTEFVVELLEDPGRDERRTVVSTFSGAVELKGLDRPENALIRKGEMAEFVEKGVLHANQNSDFLARAYLSQVRKVSESEIRRLKSATQVAEPLGASRGVASVNLVKTCQNPDADFNQCRWQCQGNPKGEKTCRADLPSVDCVRSVCKADGEWHDQTRLPASFGHYCDPQKASVGPCDY